MKKVVTSPSVDLALHTLSPEEVRQVHAWLRHLSNWDGDQSLQDSAQALAEVPGTYVLRTSSDMRIFFSIDGDTITVLDVARKQAILTTTASLSGSR